MLPHPEGGLRLKRKNLIWVALMAALLGWTAYTILKEQTPGQLAEAILSADWRVLLLGVPVMALFIGFEAKSTHWILRALDCPQPFRKCYFYSCTGFFFSNITPSATGGQPAQIYYMNRDGVPPASGTIDMLLITIGYHTAMVGYGVAALVTSQDLTERLGGRIGFLLGVGFMIFIVLNVVMILFLFRPDPARKLCRALIALAARVRPGMDRAAWEEKLDVQVEEYRRGAAVIRKTPSLFPRVLLMSAGQLGCSYGMPYLIYRAFGLTGAGLWEVFALQVLCTIAVGYLPLPGAAGAAENVFLRGFAVIFGAALVAPAMILSRTMSCYLVLVVTGIVTAVGHVRGRKPPRPAAEAPAEKKAA